MIMMVSNNKPSNFPIHTPLIERMVPIQYPLSPKPTFFTIVEGVGDSPTLLFRVTLLIVESHEQGFNNADLCLQQNPLFPFDPAKILKRRFTALGIWGGEHHFDGKLFLEFSTAPPF
ncbi:hypothetical protein TNCV_4389321 [Trichonephila clavipes]|nr:hypothetical protein TNCV_4389321 [Trichonephila clavipes]